MSSFACFRKSFSCIQLSCYSKSFRCLLTYLFRFLVFQVNPFWIQLCYFTSLSFLGFLILKIIGPKNPSYRLKDLDVFFTSVSATTVSSMSTVEMEVFSNSQLVVLTILMLLGGEVFTSMLGLQLLKALFPKQVGIENKINSVSIELNSMNRFHVDTRIDLDLITASDFECEKSDFVGSEIQSVGHEDLKYSCIKYLGFVVLGYLLVVLVCGSSLILLYLTLVSSAREVLKNKGINEVTFSVFTTVSTFANCGFIPTNENMIIFIRNSGLLLLIIPQALLGNTLYPPFLRLVIWVLRRFTKKVEFDYMLKNSSEIGFEHLLPKVHSLYLVPTVLGFIVAQFILFCCMDWNSVGLSGLNSYQKIVGVLFQSVNSRHAGEQIIDISILSQAILVLYVVMIAYGNVGLSTGYSCQRQLKPNGNCKDAWYGLSGRCSKKGKLIIIFVMIFGRLKKFNRQGGEAWKLI
ncbi:cation transporter HKT1;3-like isoform X1 [Tasmannia lanceolata]|uniref:cation transporter HKT1;3-like isoform X1 n=1 Tax=Tasmannia lanceolata TaxID=3420 RepID=UPI00406282B0